jgi:hypothetical protein
VIIGILLAIAVPPPGFRSRAGLHGGTWTSGRQSPPAEAFYESNNTCTGLNWAALKR